MVKKPEEEARETIDRMLDLAGWEIQDFQDASIYAKRGVAIRNFTLAAGQGFADYLLYVDGKAAGGIEAIKAGTTLTGVEIQSDKYKNGLPATSPINTQKSLLRQTRSPRSKRRICCCSFGAHSLTERKT
jgi:type I restriction enzyme R subunit